jgi:hypothetical protein
MIHRIASDAITQEPESSYPGSFFVFKVLTKHWIQLIKEFLKMRVEFLKQRINKKFDVNTIEIILKT